MRIITSPQDSPLERQNGDYQFGFTLSLFLRLRFLVLDQWPIGYFVIVKYCLLCCRPMFTTSPESNGWKLIEEEEREQIEFWVGPRRGGGKEEGGNAQVKLKIPPYTLSAQSVTCTHMHGQATRLQHSDNNSIPIIREAHTHILFVRFQKGARSVSSGFRGLWGPEFDRIVWLSLSLSVVACVCVTDLQSRKAPNCPQSRK